MARLLIFLAMGFLAQALPAPDRWVPLRWPSSDPASLKLLDGGPLNCLLIPEANWSGEFAKAAHQKGFVTLAVLNVGQPVLPRAKMAIDVGLDGIVLEGEFSKGDLDAVSALNKPFISLGLRGAIDFSSSAPPIIGTFQGVWAGINPHEEDSAKAAPSGSPWVDTNAGFLRFVRAMSNRSFWLGAAAPNHSVVTVVRYLQMIGDAAMVGARWVITFEPAFYKRLFSEEKKALEDFKKINLVVAFLEANRALTMLPAYGQLAVVADVENGALLSGSILDMITVKHTPVRTVPSNKIRERAFEQAKMAVDVDPQSLDAKSQEVLRSFAQGGGIVLTAPPGWRMPAPRAGQITLDAKDVEKLDQIWKEVNAMTGRRNLGARLFNVSSMLSNMMATPDGSKVVLFMVNYADFPVDTIAVHLLGKFKKATVYLPEKGPKQIGLYDNEDGSGLDIDIVESIAILVAEK